MNMRDYERQWAPIKSTADASRRGLINEAAFNLFSDALDLGSTVTSHWVRDNIDRAFQAAYDYIHGRDPKSNLGTISLTERREAAVIAARLYSFFNDTGGKSGGIVISPSFRGCGIIGECKGDVLTGNGGLYEIKSGDRPFRSVDYRQISVYLALHFSSSREVLPTIHLLNPRTGILIDLDTEDFSQGVAGIAAVSFCRSMVDSFSANLVSE